MRRETRFGISTGYPRAILSYATVALLYCTVSIYISSLCRSRYSQSVSQSVLHTSMHTVENLWVCEGENIPIVFRLRVMF